MSVTAGIVIAALIGAISSTVIGEAALKDWAWRIPFLLGGLLAVVGLVIRRSLQETDVFDASRDGRESARTRQLIRGLVENRRSVARVLGLSLGVTVAYYTWAVGIPGFAIANRGVDATAGLWASVAANLFFMATLPVWGAVSDRVGRRPVFLTYGIAMVVLTFPLMALINDSALRLAAIMMIALFFLGAFVGIMPAYFAGLFPTAVRASGVGVPYSPWWRFSAGPPRMC